MPVYNLRYKHNLILQHFDNILVFAVHVLLVPGFREFAVHGPHFPRHAFRLERPAGAALLEELEANRPSGRRGGSVHGAQKIREIGYLSFDYPPESVGLATHIREVDKIAVDVYVADGSYGVALLAVVGEFPARAMEENRVEDAGYDLVHLSPLHRQFKRDGPCVHIAVSGQTTRKSALST